MAYLDVLEASKLTGVSLTSIRRLSKKATGEQKRYIDGRLCLLDTYLYSVYPPLKEADHMDNHLDNLVNQMDTHLGNQVEQSNTNGVDGVLQKEYYQNLLAAKDETIKVLSEQVQSKDTQINQLLERDRESNIIIQSLQEKVTLQLKPGNSTSTGLQSNTLTDKLLMSVAIVSAVALLAFIGLMIYAWTSR